MRNKGNDVIFKSRLGTFDETLLLSFTQADAYEPLILQAFEIVLPPALCT